MARKKESNKASESLNVPMSRDPERRASTIYFHIDLLKRLKIFCINADRDMSRVVEDAVIEHLDRKEK
jgi:hypothetical protein